GTSSSRGFGNSARWTLSFLPGRTATALMEQHLRESIREGGRSHRGTCAETRNAHLIAVRGEFRQDRGPPGEPQSRPARVTNQLASVGVRTDRPTKQSSKQGIEQKATKVTKKTLFVTFCANSGFLSFVCARATFLRA